MFRRTRRLLARNQGRALILLSAIVVLGLLPWPKPQEAVADEDVEKFEQVALSDVAISQRLIAIEQLRKKGGASSLAALGTIAEEGDLAVACAATAALGRTGSAASKDVLKGLLEDSSLNTNVRIAASSAIAEGWKDDDDLDYLDEEMKGNGALSAHYSVLRTRTYGKGE